MALDRVRRRHRRRLVRPVPVLAARGRADGSFGWQTTLIIFAGVMLLILPLSIALADAARPAPLGGSWRAAAVVRAGAGRGLRPPQLRAAGARLLHLRLPARLRHRASAVLSASTAAFRRRDRRLDARHHRPVQHRRLAGVRLSRQPHAEALHPVDHLFRPRAVDRRLHHAAGEPASTLIFGAVTGPALAVDRAADLGAGGAHVRHALARHAVRLRLLQPPGRRLPRRLARRLRVRAPGSYDPVWWLSVFFGVAVGGHQPADRRAAGRPARAGR